MRGAARGANHLQQRVGLVNAPVDDAGHELKPALAQHLLAIVADKREGQQ